MLKTSGLHKMLKLKNFEFKKNKMAEDWLS